MAGRARSLAPRSAFERRLSLTVVLPLALCALFALALVVELRLLDGVAWVDHERTRTLVAATLVAALLLGAALCLFARRQLRAVVVDYLSEGEIGERRHDEAAMVKLNTELEQRVADLAAANRELETFSYSVSHDLRGPLRAIDGFSKILMEQYRDKLDQQGQHYLDRVRAGSQRMGHLIDDLLSLARISRAEMRRSDVDLAQIAREIVEELRRQSSERTVDVVIADGTTARGDPRLLRTALENLLGNAWKFTSKTTAPRIELGCERRDGVACYFVRDNGAGFDMAYAHKLFAPFQRLHQQSEFEGTGVGLATVHRIITRHGGKLWAESTVNRGATFWFTLGAA